MFHIVNGVTNRVTAETEFPLAVTNDFEHTASRCRGSTLAGVVIEG